MTAAPALPGRTRPAVRIAQLALIAIVGAGALRSGSDPIAWTWYVAYGAVGTVLAIRRPTNPIGWLLIVIGTLLAVQDDDVTAIQTVANGTADLATTFWVWFGTWSGAVIYVAYLILAIIFPGGGLPEGRWRRPAIAAIVIAIAEVMLMAFAPMIGTGDVAIPNPVALLAWLPLPIEFFEFAPYLVLLSLVALGVASQVIRFRRATGALRQQLRWLASAVVLIVAGLVVGFAASALGSDPNGRQWLVVALAYPLVPIAIGIAVLRYRLYAIDRIISRTLAYALVLAILGTAFVALILALQTVLAPVTGGETIAVAASTLAVFALFQPVLRRVRAAVDRRFDRTRYDADMTVRTFATRLRGDVDLSTVSAEIVGTATTAVRPAAAGIWLRTKAAPTRPAA
jgi:hypothetical protein